MPFAHDTRQKETTQRMTYLNPVSHKVLLETRSRILHQSVTNSLSSLGIEICTEPSDEVVLRLIHLTSTGLMPTVRETRVPIVLIGDVAQSNLADIAAASSPFPFLSNDLRKIVGRILQVPVRDSEGYDLADRPVPISRSVQEPRDAVAHEPQLKPTREVLVPKGPPAIVPPLDTQADLPQVSHLESQRSSLHYAEDTISPPVVTPPPAVETLPADAIETISEAYIEKVVWEVVPRLAERILREEIARLLREESTRS